MAYNLILTESFDNDLDLIIDYIINTLYNRPAAAKLYEKVKESLLTAAEFPEAFPLHSRFGSKGYRFFPVGNFIVFYSVDKSAQAIYAETIVYGSRDLSSLE